MHKMALMSLYFDWVRYTRHYFYSALRIKPRQTVTEMLDLYIILTKRHHVNRPTKGAWRTVIDDLVERGVLIIEGDAPPHTIRAAGILPPASDWMDYEIKACLPEVELLKTAREERDARMRNEKPCQP